MVRIIKLVALLLCISILITPVVGVEEIVVGQTSVSAVYSELIFSADPFVDLIGYTVNGEDGVERLVVSGGDRIEIHLNYLPPGTSLETTLGFAGMTHVLTDHPLVLHVAPHSTPASITVNLSLIGYVPPAPSDPESTPDEGGGLDPRPFIPVIPVDPDTPSDPEHPDTPGSDEPLVPILPPADSVYNFAGFIPLLAGFFLLFLLVFWRRKVYRILKKHAKEHGEKPERKQLRATADAIIQLIRDEEKYPKWRKNSELTKRLETDIIRTLDEMQYPPTIPRDAVVADIIKAAKGRINRHRL